MFILHIATTPMVILIEFLLGFIWTLQYPAKSPLLIIPIYSGVFIVIAAYLATKGITNLPKRIILFLIIGLLICMAASTPFLVDNMST